jgi:tagatose-1,6-bisphosphate aldolase non-catalytic subunit AgaZ/GatZ
LQRIVMGAVRAAAEKRNVPVVDLILKTTRAMGRKATLLAVCPNSEAVTRAAVLCAKEADSPMLYAATLNQVDLVGGYTGWTPADLMRMVRGFAVDFGFQGDLVVCSDHCGPFCKDVQTIQKWPIDPAMWGIAASLVACMQAGYDLLHVDPTIDKTLPKGESIRIETVIDRTLTLIAVVERFRRFAGRPAISYEVGTEEVHGGLADVSTFHKFISGLRDGLKSLGLSDVWPVFIVGKVGTDLDTAEFDPKMAGDLVAIAEKYGSFIKGHYTDNCSNLEDYPRAGMGGANVGPEFTMAEYGALMALLDDEARLVKAGKAKPSGFKQALTQAVVDSARWKKWLHADEQGKGFDDLASDRREWLTQTGCRYIWTAPRVLETRKALYENLSPNGIDAESRVLRAIVDVMMNYVDKFNLRGLQTALERQLGATA